MSTGSGRHRWVDATEFRDELEAQLCVANHLPGTWCRKLRWRPRGETRWTLGPRPGRDGLLRASEQAHKIAELFKPREGGESEE